MIEFWQQYKTDKTAIGSSLVVALLLLVALSAPLISPFDPYDLKQLDIMDSELPPFGADADDRFLLGTDDQGRDLLSALFYGLRLSLIIGLGAVIFQAILGVVLGLFAGYYGGKLDSILMRLADIQLSFSTMMVAIIILAIFKSIFDTQTYHTFAIAILIFVIGLSEWPKYARTVRASVLAEKEKEYVQAGRVLGIGNMRIMFRHILPNSLSPILVIATFQIAEAIITEASLSFLGLGMPPTEPSLGSLISIGFHYIFSGSYWITLFPSTVLIVLVFSINLFGDWLRDYFNPKIYND